MKRVLTLFLSILAVGTHARDPRPMFNPVIDDPDREWSYGGRTTTVLGTPFQPGVSQFTFDGSIFCPENAELHFFTGENDQPVFARQRTWMHGWLPIVEYEWIDNDLDYRLEAFGNALDGIGAGNVVHFARLSVRNNSQTTKTAHLGTALRGSGMDYRDGKVSGAIQSSDVVTIDAQHVFVGRALSAIYQGENLQVEQTLGIPYAKPFDGFTAGIRPETSYAVARRTEMLAPGTGINLTAIIPRLRIGNAEQIAIVKAADYDAERTKCIAFWEDFFKRGTINVPEDRVNDSHRASLVHLALATRSDDGVHEKRQGSGLPYPKLFLNDYIDMMMAWMRSGHTHMHQYSVEWIKGKQVPETGMFIDVHNRGNNEIITSHGHAIFSLAYPPVFNHDVEAGKDVFPYVKRGIDLIIRDHKNPEYHGLLRPSVPYDAPMVSGQASCHNFLGLTGLRAGIRLARLIGEDELADEWMAIDDSYTKAIMTAITDTYKKEGYVRSRLYADREITADFILNDRQYKKHAGKPYNNQDWENVYMGYPSELLPVDDPMYLNTLDIIRARKYREGVSTYRNGMHIHQYNTVNMAHQFLVTGQQQKALVDLYHILLHNGPTHEGFENLVEPWTDRTPSAHCPPPHAWAAAKIALFLRNMMVLEYGGRLGIDEDERNLHLFNLIAPTWAQPGEQLSINAIPTEFGDVSAGYRFVEGGATVTIDSSNFRKQPAHIVLRVPYFVELISATSDAGEPQRMGSELLFSPDVTSVELKWTLKPEVHEGTAQKILTRYRSEYPRPMFNHEYATTPPPKAELTAEEKAWPAEPLSFGLIRTVFSHEYKQRFDRYVAEGKQPQQVAAPPLVKATPTDNLEINAPGRTVNAPTSANRNPESARFAADGNRSSQEFCWTAEQPTDWWQVSLPDDSVVSELTIVARGADDNNLPVSYLIEYSQEGGMWQPLVEQIKPSKHAPKGARHRFDPVKLRYIRVKLTNADKNSPKRLLELIVP